MGPANAGLEHRPEPTADLLCDQVLQRRPVDQIQLGLCAGNFRFPFVALNWCRIAGDLDRLNMTLADTPNTQHQALLAKRMFVVIEIDRRFSGVLRALAQRLDHWNSVKAPQSRRFDFEFEFQFFLQDHDVCHRPEALRPIVNAFPEESFRNTTTMRSDFLATDQKLRIPAYVRFAPKNGHFALRSLCPLWANLLATLHAAYISIQMRLFPVLEAISQCDLRVRFTRKTGDWWHQLAPGKVMRNAAP